MHPHKSKKHIHKLPVNRNVIRKLIPPPAHRGGLQQLKKITKLRWMKQSDETNHTKSASLRHNYSKTNRRGKSSWKRCTTTTDAAPHSVALIQTLSSGASNDCNHYSHRSSSDEKPPREREAQHAALPPPPRVTQTSCDSWLFVKPCGKPPPRTLCS